MHRSIGREILMTSPREIIGMQLSILIRSKIFLKIDITPKTLSVGLLNVDSIPQAV
jgi:hypothetical protein